MMPNYNTKEELQAITRIDNVLTITYRNTIELDGGTVTELEPLKDDGTLGIDANMFFRYIEFLMNIRDLGYYIPASQSLSLLASLQVSAKYTDIPKPSYENFDLVLTEIENILGGQEAKFTYKTLFGNGIFADTLRGMGVDPYVYQLMHYMHVYDGVETPAIDAIQEHSKDVYESKESFATMMAKCSGRSEEDIIQMVLQVFPEDLTDGSYQRLDIVPTSRFLPMEIFVELIGSNNPMSGQMKSQIRDFVRIRLNELNLPLTSDSVQFTVPCKETLAFLITEFINDGYPANSLTGNINNATDVLRAFAMYSDPEYDGSLAKAPKFKNHLNANEARFFMNLLCHAPHVETDIFMYPEMWKRAFERIKPQRCMGKRYKKIRQAADNLYKGKKPQTTNALVEKILAHAGDSLNSFEQGLKKLENFPGMYLRHFDKYIRSYGSKISDDARENRHFQYLVCQSLHHVVPQAESTKMLCQLMTLYYKRLHNLENHKDGIRYAKPKGQNSYVPLLPVQETLCEKTYLKNFYVEILNILTQEITYRFKELPYLGKVFIDPTACGIVVPTELREANDTGLHIIGRGSYFKMISANEVAQASGEGMYEDVYVPYIHWAGHYDLDLSAVFMDEKLHVVDECYYNNMSLYDAKNGSHMYATHSGDWIDGGSLEGEGVSEFVMIRRQSALKRGARYAAITVHCYSGQPFSIANTFFGFETLAEPVGENKMEDIADLIGDGKTAPCRRDAMHAVVKPERTIFTSNLASKDDSILVAVIDLEDGIIYYADLSMKQMELRSAASGAEALDKIVGNSDKSPAKAFINPLGNNVNATALSMGTQIRALFEKPRFYCGDLIWLHAQVRGMIVKNAEDADVVYTLPDSAIAKNLEDDQELISPFMVDRMVNEFMPTK